MAASSQPLAMFPLSTLVFPGSAIPLHVFEPRYKQLTTDCLAADARFGIVLIERGAEVGGGDERSMVGTRVTMTRAVALADGRWLLVALGEQRIRVVEWLDDDPYPRALVEEWPDRASAPVEPAVLAEVVQAVRRTRALLSETRQSPALPAEVTFDDDPDVACWQLCAEAPLNVYDAQRLLCVDGTPARLGLLLQTIGELEDDLHRMLAQ
jgi:Lon protease-like protein